MIDKHNMRDFRYRAYLGPADKFDLLSVNQFNLMVALGLRDTHYLLDIGCGSLAGGRLFIPYLHSNRYHCVEPLKWLIQAGIENELGQDIIRVKQPVFSHDQDFNLSIFERKFDFILAQSIFSHAAEGQIRKCLSEACAIMKPTSIFAATFVEGDEDYDGEGWIYPGFVTYTEKHMARLFTENGFYSETIDWKHPCQQKWLIAVPIVRDNETRLKKIKERL